MNAAGKKVQMPNVKGQTNVKGQMTNAGKLEIRTSKYETISNAQTNQTPNSPQQGERPMPEPASHSLSFELDSLI
jgi:hypothetical protein